MIENFKQKNDLVFREENHRYFFKGSPSTSVTQVLSNVAVRKNGEFKPLCDNRFSINPIAANFGKSFHKIASFNLLGVDFDCPEQLKLWYEQFCRWRKDHTFLKPLVDESGVSLIEYPMAHTWMRYCGTPDVIFEAGPDAPIKFRNKIVVCDWKTSTTEMNYWTYQTAAYAELLKNVFPELIKNRKILTMSVRFEEDTFHPCTKPYEPGWSVFQSALTLINAAA